MQRRFHPRYFAIDRNEEPDAPPFDESFFDRIRLKIFGLFQSPEKCVRGQSQETEPPGAMRQIKAERSGIQTSATAEAETGQLVFVVAYKNEWRLSHKHFSVRGDAKIEQLNPPEDMKRR
jgi:hypothetical protein